MWLLTKQSVCSDHHGNGDNNYLLCIVSQCAARGIPRGSIMCTINSHENAIHSTGHLRGESTGHLTGGFAAQMASAA